MKRLVLLIAILAACAAPASEQGKSAQGGSNTAPMPTFTINIGTGGGITTTNTSAPTAAPASASTASASQTATNDTKPSLALGDKAIDAVVPLLGATDAVKKERAALADAVKVEKEKLVEPPVPEPPK